MLNQTKLSRLSDTFRNFAALECRGSSAIYEYLSLQIADDEEILLLCSHARKGQPVPNLLFGAVHYLLLKGKEHELQRFYFGRSENSADCYPYFKDFCELYRKEIIALLETKLVQTNEVRRCAYLYPAFCYIYDLVKKPLALIEIGTSAGLQLLLDQYSYSYGSGKVYGNKEADIMISSEIKGKGMPPLLMESPPVSFRAGVDLHVNDISKKEDYMWLKALIWPEHGERRELFEKAAACVAEKSLQLIEGNGIDLLSSIAKQIDNDAALVVFHTHVANQIPAEVKRQLLVEIEKIGENRLVFHLYNNIQDRDLHLDSNIDGEVNTTTLAKTEGHGKWFTWEI